MKRILITGKNSYIGTHIKEWLEKDKNQYEVTEAETKEEKWIQEDFSGYDTLIHVAGIAHVSADPKLEELYYKINRDLAVDVANKAKREGIKQFIFMSSMIIYGKDERSSSSSAGSRRRHALGPTSCFLSSRNYLINCVISGVNRVFGSIGSRNRRQTEVVELVRTSEVRRRKTCQG